MFLAVDKPARISSFDVIRILRRHFPKQKMGHSGTLDPMATGLMILALDKDTKKLTELIGLDKSYIATINFSISTDTRDMEYWNEIRNYELRIRDGIKIGVEMEHGTVDAPSISEITRKLDQLIPSHELPLPSFSAKKKDGKKLYDMARKGNHVLETKEMKIISYEIISYHFPELTLRLDVGSGTYIRSIAHWLGLQIGTGGTLTQLRRMCIGPRDIDTLANRQEFQNTYKDKIEVIRYAILQ